jgi:hypothetical protein
MTLNAGVLIIGSLLWDDDRQGWRDARLNMNQSESVLALIRYGRRSGRRRGHTYTMVFSRHAPAGHARVVRCSHAITGPDDLITEALRLWEAEELALNPGQIAANWGCVALLCNPERRISDELLRAWARRVEGEHGYGNVSQKADEGRIISKDGLLQIDWPRRVDEGAAIDLDLLLATANDPTLAGMPLSYPSVEVITNAWNGAAPKHAEYFWKNIDHGIRTFEDDQIRTLLRPREQG